VYYARNRPDFQDGFYPDLTQKKPLRAISSQGIRYAMD